MKTQTVRAAAAALLLFAVSASEAAAQRVLNWPLRTSAGPEAVLRGAEAAFWNPAGVRVGSGRGEVLIADQRTPDAIGLTGFDGAGAWRLDARTTIAAAYQHVAIDDIGETSTSPMPDEGGTFTIAEDQLAASVSHMLGAALHVGATVHYNRSNESGINESTTSLGAGFLYSSSLPLRPQLGASVLTQANNKVRYNAGLELSAPRLSPDVAVSAGYGVRGGGADLSVEHRIGITGSWRQLLAVTGGVATARAGSQRSWEPVVGASLRVSRYELGVLREMLANDFGAAYSFRFRIGLE